MPFGPSALPVRVLPGCAGNGASEVSAAYYASDQAEYYGNANFTASLEFEAAIQATGDSKPGKGLGGASVELVHDIAPILRTHGVDLFLGGHWHY